MKKTIVYSSGSGNTKKLADVIYSTIGEDIYCGKANDEALEADMLFIGSWTMAFNATPDIKKFAEKLNNKKVFLFMTVGYNHTEEFFNTVMSAFKESLNDTNEIVGEFVCQGKVSQAKQEAIKKADMAKFESYKTAIEIAETHPDDKDIANLIAKVKAVL